MRPAGTNGSLRGFSVPLGRVTLVEGAKGTDSGLNFRGVDVPGRRVIPLLRAASPCFGTRVALPLILIATIDKHKLAPV